MNKDREEGLGRERCGISIVGSERLTALKDSWASLVAQMIKCLPATWETQVQSLGWEDTLEKEMATHSSIIAWRNSMDRAARRATVHGVAKIPT